MACHGKTDKGQHVGIGEIESPAEVLLGRRRSRHAPRPKLLNTVRFTATLNQCSAMKSSALRTLPANFVIF